MADYNAPARAFLREDHFDYDDKTDEELDKYIEDNGIYGFEGDTEDYARSLAEDAGGPLETFTNAENYFDYDSFGSDLKMDSALTSHLEDDKAQLEDEVEEAERDVKDAEKDLSEAKATLKEAKNRPEDKEEAEGEVESAEWDLESYQDTLTEKQEELDDMNGTIEERENMSDQAYAEEWVDQMGGVSELGKETQERYFDYASVARDMDMGGDTTEFEYDGKTYTFNAHW